MIPYGNLILDPDLQPNETRMSANLRRLVDALSPFLAENFWHVALAMSPELTDARPFSWRAFEVRPRYTYRLDLRDLERVQEGFAKSLRHEIRKAESKGVTVSSESDVEGFVRLHDRTMERQKLKPEYRGEALRALSRNLGDRAQIYVAREEGEISCAALVLRDASRAYYAYGAADGERFGTGAPSLLQWRVIQDLSEKRIFVYDLCGANTANVVSFKEQFGGSLVAWYEVSMENSGRLPLRSRVGRIARRIGGGVRRVLRGNG
jgi:lipid II:glycine glycyltransferase (peptidoglycan interpeptide bridge formation enzyme)